MKLRSRGRWREGGRFECAAEALDSLVLNRTAFSVASLADESDEKALLAIPDAGRAPEALEIMR